jgi:hypothetical protein
MAIITDPDLIGRYDVIFGAPSQEISIYPVGDTQRGATIINAYVSSTSAITNTDGTGWTGITAGDVAAIVTGPDAGHYFVDAGPTTTVATLVEIDLGFDGAATTGLTVEQVTWSAASIATNQISITAHGYISGDAVVYTSNGAGTTPTGMTVGNVYYIIWINNNTISLASSYANALAGTALTISGGAGAAHTFDDRIIVAVFNNGAASVNPASTPLGEFINGNETTGTDDGDVKDGITLQAIYSFGKDEWRVDSLITDLSGDYNDDLIRTEYPFEAITSEQFEIGGGTAHDNWNWFNDYTRKKVRTGGWAEKTRNQVGDQDLARWTGVVTLGALDIDTQVYYQQVSATTSKTDFTFTGVVNESVQVLDDPNQDGVYGDGFDRRTYLKLFARKKGRTYAQSEIADIGVSSLQTIVNRFPLTATVDAAITITDGQIFGTAPYKFPGDPDGTSSELETGTDGDKSVGLVFTSSGATFVTNGVEPGDVLRIIIDPTSSTPDVGYYIIASVDSETQLTLSGVEYRDPNGDFVFEPEWQSLDSTNDITYDVYTSVIIPASTDAGTGSDGIINVTPAEVPAGWLGSFTDTAATFAADGVASGDILVITGGVTDTTDIGAYKIVDANFDSNASAPSATTLFVNTRDEQWPGALDADIEYEIRQPGMFLQFKDELTQTVAASNYNFNGPARTITITGDTWDASVGPGTMIVITGSANEGENDGRYTVLSRDSATAITLISTDVLVTNATDTVADVFVREGFKRTIGSGTFAYRWRLFGNNGTLQECYQFIQNQLRSTGDIDFGDEVAIGNITDPLMSFATPTGTGLDLFIDDLNTSDINNATFQDHSETSRNFPFTASGSLVFNANLTSDADSKYWLFFSNDDAGDNIGRDYGTQGAIIVEDADSTAIFGNIVGSGNHTGQAIAPVNGNISIPFTYDYDVNVQRGIASAGFDAPVTLVAIGLSNAQFVISSGTITRATGITISAVAALERNYLQGSL